MSYKPIQDTEHLDSGFHHENATLEQASNSEKHDYVEVKRRFFKSSRALHLAISVAAGTVMTLFGYEQGVLFVISFSLLSSGSAVRHINTDSLLRKVAAS